MLQVSYRYAGLLLVSFGILLSTAMTSSAQTLPTQATPGAVLQGGFDATGRPKTGEANSGLSTEGPEKDPEIKQQSPEAPRLDSSLTRKIQINQITVEGNTVLSESAIRAITEAYEGQALTLQELQDNVADPITAAYEDKGYVTSVAFIPPQTLEGGVLKVQIQEGVISEVNFEPGKHFKSRAVNPRLLTDTNEVFEVDELLRSLRRINSNPDLTLSATLRAGEESGQTKVALQVEQENQPFHISPFYDNLGRDPVGQQRIGFNVNHNNVLGLGDRYFGSFAWSTETFSNINGYEVPIGPHGTKVGFTQAFSTFGFNNQGFDFDGRSNIVNAFVKQEFLRNEKWVVEGELGFAVKNSTLEVEGVENSKDKLRVLTQALNVEQYDRTGRTFMRHELAEGFDIFAATLGNHSLTSRPGSGSQFFRYTGSVVRSQKVAGRTYAIFKALGQVSPDSLVSLEQFQAGGSATVRGYSEGRFIGDNGFVLSAEYRVPMVFLSDKLTVPGTSYRLKDGLELVGFADGGGVFDRNANSGVNAASGQVLSNTYAASIGLGLRARLTQYLNGRFDVGFPLIRNRVDGESARVHFGLESRLF